MEPYTDYPTMREMTQIANRAPKVQGLGPGSGVLSTASTLHEMSVALHATISDLEQALDNLGVLMPSPPMPGMGNAAPTPSSNRLSERLGGTVGTVQAAIGRINELRSRLDT